MDCTCDTCGRELKIGEWPWCNGTGDHSPGKYGHEPFHEYVDEHILSDGKDVGLNGAGEPVIGTRISSRDQRKAIMKAAGLEYKGRRYGGHVPTEF
jgi:hypothetical protein